MRLTDHAVDRLKEAAAESAAEQAKMAEGPTLPETFSEIPWDWLEAERDHAEDAMGRSIPAPIFLVYVDYLTDAYQRENERMLRNGERMD